MITKLMITHLRNLDGITLSPSRCNLIIGHNGSGKTSLLESLFLLSRGKSFRTHQPKRYIQHHQSSTTVFAQFDNSHCDNTTLAIQKHTDASTFLKLNGDNIKTQSELTRHMPTLLIDPSSMDVLEQGSASRRQLLDWLAFHVKQEFYPQWLAYQRLLKQRNSLLKQITFLSPLHRQQIAAWDVGLSHHAQLIHQCRQEVFDAWLPHFADSVRQLLPHYATQLSVSYQAGFDTKPSLYDTLQQRLQQDMRQGYTRVGSHRADIHVYWKSSGSKDNAQSIIKEQASNVLSRGEKKLLITALRLSQLPLLQQQKAFPSIDKARDVPHETSNQSFEEDNSQSVDRYTKDMHQTISHRSVPIILLDDITAELDAKAIEVLLTTLSNLSCQVFITSLSEDIKPMIADHWQEYQMFHVKHGKLIPLETDEF